MDECHLLNGAFIESVRRLLVEVSPRGREGGGTLDETDCGSVVREVTPQLSTLSVHRLTDQSCVVHILQGLLKQLSGLLGPSGCCQSSDVSTLVSPSLSSASSPECI